MFKNIEGWNLIMAIEKLDYKLNGILDCELDIIEELANDFDQDNSSYVCDAISEKADSYTPIYYNEIWENARDIDEYIEQAVSEGFVDTSNFDLMKLFQAGYYVYNTEVLYENFGIIAFNKVVDYVNIYLNEQNKYCDEKLLEEQIGVELALFDSNNRISDIGDIVKAIIELIEDGDFDE